MQETAAPPPEIDQPVEVEVSTPAGGGAAEDVATESTDPLTPLVEEASPEPSGNSAVEVEGDSAQELVAEVQASGKSDALSWIDFFKPDGIPYALVMVIVMMALARLVSRQAESLGERFADRRLVISQTASFVRFLVYMLGIMAVFFTMFEISEQMVLAIGGTVAVAAGFAMKDLVASIVAGVIILIDRPFSAGDRVTFAGYYGEITHIGLRSCRMNTLDDTQVTIPNNLFLTQAVASGNAGAVDMMIQVDLFIGLDQDLEEARRLLSEVVTTSRYVNLNRNWAVLASEEIVQNYLAIRLRAKAYVLDARLEKSFEGDITERALQAFRAADIGPPAVLHRNIGD
jgi:small-conductance mechanosensitive channel